MSAINAVKTAAEKFGRLVWSADSPWRRDIGGISVGMTDTGQLCIKVLASKELENFPTEFQKIPVIVNYVQGPPVPV